MKASPRKIVVIYSVISIGWMLGSNYLVDVLSSITVIDEPILRILKGLCFIFITAWLLYMAITKQQKALSDFGDQYKSLFHSNPNPLWIYDFNSLSFLEVNQTAIRTYGYSREEFKRMTILDIRPEEDRQKVRESVKNLTNEPHISGHWRHLKKNGDVMTVAITSHRIKFNNHDCAMAMALDITARLKQEQKLEAAYIIEKELREELEKNMEIVKQSLESKNRLAEVVDRINNMVMIGDTGGRVEWVNQAFEDFTGYKLKEVAGKPSDFLFGAKTDLEVVGKIRELLAKSGFANSELVFYTKAGEEYWVDSSVSAIYNEKNEFVRSIAILNIITERKKREEKIKEQNGILRKHSWINSHAIRKPVASILSLASLCKDMNQTEEIKEINLLIERSALELDRIVKEIGREINSYEDGGFAG